MYTCRGSVRGECGIKHRNIMTAMSCCKRDGFYCEKQHGYSDRRVIRLDGEPLSEEEHDILVYGT